MWIVFKYKSKEYNIFKKSIKTRLGNDVRFYNPRIKYSKLAKNKIKFFEKYLLDNYAFCYSKLFQEKKFLSSLLYIKGLCYFLQGYIQDQTQIVSFINFCKKNEESDGNLKQSFFSEFKIKKAKFLSGPFSNIIFEILEKKKSKIKILLGNKEILVNNNKHNFYYPV